MKAFLEKEKSRLLQAREFMESFYKQIYNSIINLRDTLFSHAFPDEADWKKQLLPNCTTFSLQDYQLISTEGKIQNNSEFIVNVLNNIQAILNLYIPRLDTFSLSNGETVKAVNKYTWDFIQRLYAKENTTFLAGQRLEAANTIKGNIKDRLENNIAPFFSYLEQILLDEYTVILRPELQRIVGVYAHYITNPAQNDRLIRQRCEELNLVYDQEIIINIIANLSKDQMTFVNEIKSRYQNEEVADQKKNVFRLKEIAARFVAQAANINRLENFVQAVQTVFQPVSFLKRLFDFIRKMFTGSNRRGTNKDFLFYYISRSGKLEKKHTSLKSLLKDLGMFKSFLVKFKGTLDFYSYTKSSSMITSRELENIIDNCITELTKIHEQCNGMREWLVSSKNQKNLARLPVSRQEEFNDLLLAINYTLIINKQHLRDLDRHAK